MEHEQQSLQTTPGRSHPAVSPAVRQRLQKVFEHGRRCAEKNDYDYANQLFTQCVVEDPGNLIYLQHFFANLHQKYGDNKKGAKLAGLKIKSHRSTLTKAAGKGDWEAAFQAGCHALALNPWDIPTLLAMAAACEQLQIAECQLFYLRAALSIDSHDVEVNRQAGQTLQRMGQFDQAIACWQRVQQAQPQDEQSRQAISRLSVEKTIHEGGYDSTVLADQEGAQQPGSSSVAMHARDASPAESVDTSLSPEERMQAAISKDPTELENYVRLADIYLHEQRFDEAEQILGRGQQAAGGGDLQVMERIEEVQMRRAGRQLAIAEQHYQQDPSEEHQQLVARFRTQANQVELEIYAAQAERDPENTRLKYELGLRLKRAGKTKEAIPLLQASRGDSKRKAAIVLLELGECFQKIEQYKLAQSHYEQAIDACEEPDSQLRRLGLYRAGVLCTGLRELDRAERYLTELAGLDYSYRDVADRLDKLAQLRDSG
ncbi:MAG: tetratricopeptide repeat protein [Pirellulales bacterium]|nr:tetratricopeptide repeat protein [Pirellulales bacterium]